MTELFALLGYALAAAALAGYAGVAGSNWWRIVAPRVGGGGEGEAGSLTFVAGPVLLLAAVQGLRMAAVLGSARGVGLVLFLGLVLDPAALPAAALALVRRFRPGRPHR